MSETEHDAGSQELSFANMLVLLKQPVELSCDYRNWRGEVANRRIRLIEFWYGSTEWHPEPGLLLKAIDLDTGKERDFRVTDFDTATLRVI
jgi:predicted esterase|nr:hypothetical protein [Neorhizobium tomejilense]